MKDMVLKMNEMKEMKEQKVMEMIEKDINSFALLVFRIAVDLAINAVNELIEDIMEDNINKKETEKEKIRKDEKE